MNSLRRSRLTLLSLIPDSFLAQKFGYPKSRARTTHLLLARNVRRFGSAVSDPTDGSQNASANLWRVSRCMDGRDAVLPGRTLGGLRVCPF